MFPAFRSCWQGLRLLLHNSDITFDSNICKAHSIPRRAGWPFGHGVFAFGTAQFFVEGLDELDHARLATNELFMF